MFVEYFQNGKILDSLVTVSFCDILSGKLK